MPIKIHHGPPGSFKTAGAIADDYLREAKSGRIIVTNVRGVSRDRTLEEFPELPDSFDVIFVDDKTTEGRLKWAKWFHWVPHGAFILVDEVQDIWPKRWKESDIRSLDYAGGVDKATADDRPKDWEQALDKHRHYNWDMTLTCPSYAKVRDDIKGIADMAYKHKDLGLLGWSGRYIEGAHAADDTGKNAADFVNVQNKKVPSYVFKLYDSTQTGLFSGTKSGFNLLKNPRIALLLVIVIGLVVWVSTRPVPKVISGVVHAPSASAPSSVGAASPSGPLPASAMVGTGYAGFSSGQDDPVIAAFGTGDMYLVGSVKNRSGLRYVVRFNYADFELDDFLQLGFTVTTLGNCGVLLSKGEFHRVVLCGHVPDKTDLRERSAATVDSRRVPEQQGQGAAAQAEKPNNGT